VVSEFDPTATGLAVAVAEAQAPRTNGDAHEAAGNGAKALVAEALRSAESQLHVASAPPEVVRAAEARLRAAAQIAEAPAAVPAPPPIPAPPPAVVLRDVHGTYRSSGAGFQLEVRVDVDGRRPMMRVSGDFYQVSGGTTTYHSSLRVDSPVVSIGAAQVTIEGLGTFTFPAGAPKVRVTIPRTSFANPPAPATVQFFTLSNAPGATYVCNFQTTAFRTVMLEQDYQTGVTPFTSYDTASLPSGGPGRVLTVEAAYNEAGIQMQTAGTWNQIPAPPGGTWSNAELLNAMQVQFSLWSNLPHWATWLLAAYEHEIGAGLYGIMFDTPTRQGCATFHLGIGGATPEQQRLQLYTYTHELGHCFNLLHSWQKSLASPPAPNRPAALSWMNYPWNYPNGGAAGFWSAFPFQFDDLELVHLRHAFRNDIIQGGNPFTVGAALLVPHALADPVEDTSGIGLELAAKRSVALGEPVVVEIKLRATDTRGKLVHSQLHPNFGAVQIAIRKPSGRMIVHEPLIDHCGIPEQIELNGDRPAIYDSAYLGYGKGGFAFDEVGPYQIRALYAALDGSQIVSNILDVVVRAPISAADQDVAELLMGPEQGTLLYVLGSDSGFLQSGNEALQRVVDEHGDHPLAVYARMAMGVNLARQFKSMTREKKIEVRAPKPHEAREHLAIVADATEAGRGVDNITLNQVMRSLARGQRAVGDDEGAKQTVDRMVGVLRDKGLKPHVMRVIDEQAKQVLEGPTGTARA